MSDEPTSPFSPLAEGAISMHEFMTSYVEAGFTRDEAYGLVCTVMSATIMARGSR